MKKTTQLLFCLLCAPYGLLAQSNTSGIKVFYAWWMLLTGLIFGLIFYTFWKILKREPYFVDEKIEGVYWFSRALTIWGISGLCGLLAQTTTSVIGAIGAIILQSIFSTINSALILFVLPSIEIASDNQWLNRIVAWCRHKASIVSLAVASLVLTILISLYLLDQDPAFSNRTQPFPQVGYWVYLPDICFSLATILVLLQVLSAAFKDRQRGVGALLWVVYLTLFVTMLAEISLLFPANGILGQYAELVNILSATLFKMLLITLFSILLYSYEKKKAEEQRIEGLLPVEVIKKRWNLDERDIKVLQLLANGKTRDEIGEDENLFPRQRASARKNVDDLLGKIPAKFGLPENNRTQQMILLFALQHKIIQFSQFSENNTVGNISGDLSGNIPAEK